MDTSEFIKKTFNKGLFACIIGVGASTFMFGTMLFCCKGIGIKLYGAVAMATGAGVAGVGVHMLEEEAFND